jgi:hypothetical protein
VATEAFLGDRHRVMVVACLFERLVNRIRPTRLIIIDVAEVVPEMNSLEGHHAQLVVG